MSEEKIRLKREAKERGDKLPGSTASGAQNTLKRSQQVDNEAEKKVHHRLRGMSCVLHSEKTHINIHHIQKEMLRQKEVRKAGSNGSFDIFGSEVIN
jgi:hypothetical protein